MRLIDADKLKEHDFGDDYYVIKSEIDTEPTVQAIPIEVLDKIKAEISKLKGTFPNEYYLKIIDKYRAESEG